jgi:hypothetical protein
LQIRSPPVVYPAAGACIYCGENTDLGKEHIIAEGLGGNLIFLKASCSECGRKTSQAELACLRRMLGKFRAVMGVKTKRPKARPTTLVLETSSGDGPTRRRLVKVSDYPRTLMMMRLDRPPILKGLPPSDNLTIAGAWSGLEEGGLGAVQPDETIYSDFWSIDAFLLMIAKIGHAYARAVLPHEEAESYEQLLPPYIRGITPEYVGHVVGGVPEVRPPDPGVVHSLHLIRETIDGMDYLSVGIRLFAYWGAPEYVAVFGRRPHR